MIFILILLYFRFGVCKENMLYFRFGACKENKYLSMILLLLGVVLLALLLHAVLLNHPNILILGFYWKVQII